MNEQYSDTCLGDRKLQCNLKDRLAKKKLELENEIRAHHSTLINDTTEFLDAMREFHKNVRRDDDNDDYIDKLHRAEIKMLDILISASQEKVTKEEIETQLQEIEWPDISINAKPIEIMKGILCIFLGTLTGLVTLASSAVFGISLLAAQPLLVVVSGTTAVGLSGVTCTLFDKGLSFFKSPKEKMEDSLEKLAKNIEKNDGTGTAKDSSPLLLKPMV